MSIMAANKNTWPENVQTPRVHPQKFALWLAMAVMAMSFAGLTSAYIVRSNAPDWTDFVLPFQFTISGIIIILSSITIQGAVWSFKREKIGQYKLALGATLALSVAFLVSQWLGWQELQRIGLYLDGNPAGSFVYVISYLHVAHIAIGILLLTIAFIKSVVLFGNPANLLIYTTDRNKKIGIELLATYWHFVGLLWLYLLIFFTLS